MNLKKLEPRKCECCGGNDFEELDCNLIRCKSCDTVYYVQYSEADLAWKEYNDKKNYEQFRHQFIERQKQRVEEKQKRKKKNFIPILLLDLICYCASASQGLGIAPLFGVGFFVIIIVGCVWNS